MELAGSVEHVVQRVQAIAGPQVALELQWDLEEGDAMDTSWVLDLHVIVEALGWDHSRYTSVRVARHPAETTPERREAHERARAVAATVGLPLHAPPVEDHGGAGGSRWIEERGGAAEPVAYATRWEASFWTVDGEHHASSGVKVVPATSGAHACAELRAELVRLLPDRPLSVRTFLGEPSTGWHTFSGDYPPTLPPAEAVRDLALAEACSASRIARALVAHDPSVTPRSLMVAFDEAFDLPAFPSLETWAPLARWRRGALDDGTLDAALCAKLETARPTWDRPRALRVARAEGRPIGPMIRTAHAAGVGILPLIIATRRAFDLGLADAKMLVESWCGDADDTELDALLANRPA